MQADLSVWENNIGQGDIIEQKQNYCQNRFKKKTSLLYENQVPSAAPAEAVVGN